MSLIVLGLLGVLMQAAAAPSSVTVSGRVLEEGTQAPIAAAQVTLFRFQRMTTQRAFPGPDRPRIATTDSNGRYVFEGVDAGQYRIAVQKAGFAVPDEFAINPSGLIDLKAGERRTDVNMTMQRGAVIVGRIFDASGEPLADVQMMAMRKPPLPPGVPPGVARSDFLVPGGQGAQSNDVGEFRLFGLPSGEYIVQATPNHNFGPQAPSATTRIATFYPGTSDPAAAQRISVGPGQTVGDIAITMIEVPAFQVSGVVLTEAGRPVANAMIRLQVEERGARPFQMMGRWNQSRTDASGRFTIDGVTSDSYTLLAVAPVVVSRAAPPPSRPVQSGGTFSFGVSGGFVSGTVGGGLTTETGPDGTTVHYADDTATRLPVTVSDANVSGLEVVVRPPAR
jgi:protocatechuate 3,4-dioxygenase beta subunit